MSIQIKHKIHIAYNKTCNKNSKFNLILSVYTSVNIIKNIQ